MWYHRETGRDRHPNIKYKIHIQYEEMQMKRDRQYREISEHKIFDTFSGVDFKKHLRSLKSPPSNTQSSLQQCNYSNVLTPINKLRVPINYEYFLTAELITTDSLKQDLIH